jgi:glutamine amidotransferase/cyclase
VLSHPLTPGPNGERFCWYQATVKGGREGRPIDAVRLARVCQELGAGEILLNCVDMDGQCRGYDHGLIGAVKAAVTIPVIASSGAGAVEHFADVSAGRACGLMPVEIGESGHCGEFSCRR